MLAVGRRRTRDFHLPPQMTERNGRFYYGRNQTALGKDFPAALRKYAEMHGGTFKTETFAQVAAEYLSKGCPRSDGKPKPLAAETLKQYTERLPGLIFAFGHMTLAQIRPVHVRQYLTARGNTVAATRDKAILSAIYSFARNVGIFDGANPCIGITGTSARSERYVTDAELSAVLAVADDPTRDFLELCYITGQRPSDVLRMRRTDVVNGALCVAQSKTGAKVRITVAGPLAVVLARSYPVGSVYLVRDERGQQLTLEAIRLRFWKARKAAGQDWQIRDLRAKAATDIETGAQALLGHAHASMTDNYIRRHVGATVAPVMRDLRK